MPDSTDQQAHLPLLLRHSDVTRMTQGLKIVLMILAVYVAPTPIDRVDVVDFEDGLTVASMVLPCGVILVILIADDAPMVIAPQDGVAGLTPHVICDDATFAFIAAPDAPSARDGATASVASLAWATIYAQR